MVTNEGPGKGHSHNLFETNISFSLKVKYIWVVVTLMNVIFRICLLRALNECLFHDTFTFMQVFLKFELGGEGEKDHS